MRRAPTKAVSLKWTHQAILRELRAHAGKPVSAERLAQVVWWYANTPPRSWRAMLTNEITALRRALPNLKHSILTVRGNGYIFARALRQK